MKLKRPEISPSSAWVNLAAEWEVGKSFFVSGKPAVEIRLSQRITSPEAVRTPETLLFSVRISVTPVDSSISPPKLL